MKRISVVRNDRIIPLFPVRPMNKVVRSAPNGLLVEAHNLGPMEIPEHEHSSFCLTLQTGEQVGTEWWSEGRHGRESHRCGSMVLVTPGTRDRMRWDGLRSGIRPQRGVPAHPGHPCKSARDEPRRATERNRVTHVTFRRSHVAATSPFSRGGTFGCTRHGGGPSVARLSASRFGKQFRNGFESVPKPLADGSTRFARDPGRRLQKGGADRHHRIVQRPIKPVKWIQ